MDNERPVRLLSLDGGGIRGLSSILILKDLMRHVNQDRDPNSQLQPWQVFDLIGGTSTGGIIAIMLGCLRMTVDECEEAYIRLAKTIFKPKRWKYNAFSRGVDFFSASERYDSSKLESVVKEIIKARTGSDKTPLSNFTEDGFGKVFVTTVQTDDNELLLLRSYETRQEIDKHSKQFQLWEALRATSAATTYFKEYRRGNAGYLDGALKSNNPIFQVRQEARDQWPDREAFLISIGTGTKPSVPLRGNLIHLARTLTKLVTETEETWNRFRGSHKEMLKDSLLFRYSVPELGGVDLGNHKLMGMVRTNTERHLREAATEKYVTACAKKMMEIESGEFVTLRMGKSRALRLEDLSEQEKDCLRSLHATSGDYESQRLGIDKPVPGTCKWFLRHPKFVNWERGSASSLLWVTANPGCGKSVLSSFLVDTLNDESSRPIVCSFFFKAGIDSRRSSHQALCVLLHQLFVAAPNLVQAAMEDYCSKDILSFTKDVEALWAILCEAVSRLSKRKVICIIDALDECSDQSRNRFISQLVTAISANGSLSSVGNLKFLVTSRPWPSIESRFRNLLSIRLRGEDESPALSADVEKMIEHRVRELKKSSFLSTEASSLVAKILTEGADRTFLWVSLVFDAIERLQSRKLSSIERSLESLPGDLDQLYESALAAFVDPKASYKLLSMVLAAKRPLKLDELNVALSFEENTISLEALSRELEPNAEHTIKELGGFFIRIMDSTVFLVHQTARDFLLSRGTNLVEKQPIHRVDLELANFSLARTCIGFIQLEGLPVRPQRPMTEEERVKSNEILLANLPGWAKSFYVYASTEWASHLGGDEVFKSTSDIHDAVRSICDSSKPYFSAWWYLYVDGKFFAGSGKQHPHFGDCAGRCFAHWSTLKGSPAATRGLLESGTSVAGELDAYGCDLLYHCASRRDEQAHWILENTDHATLHLLNFLERTVSEENWKVFQQLLHTQVQIKLPEHEARARYYSLTVTALRRPKFLEPLLNRGLTICGKEFLEAAEKGCHESLALLIDRRPQAVEDLPRVLKEVLVRATELGYPRCRTVVLRHLSSDAAIGLDLSAGLIEASYRGDRCSIRELGAMGALDQGKGLAFSCALGDSETAAAFINSIAYPREVLVEGLSTYYDSNMGSELKESCLKTLRNVVASRGKLFEGFRLFPIFGFSFEDATQLLELLSARGIFISRRRFVEATAIVVAMDDRFSYWLAQAASKLQNDPTLAAKDFFLLACFWGKPSLVQLGVSGAVDINKQDGSGITPLMAATASGSLEVVRLLLEKGANPDQRCKALVPQRGTMSDIEWELASLCIHFARGLGIACMEGSPRSLARQMGQVEIEEVLNDVG
ncbi:ankyrin repeat protein [Colletotrichum abscissum]|uniref:phospholipase A2 n=1 Tax=Colletotrichum abscissum TaxID=1671311 RepID=A0A9P9XMJ5_9PEZI|nr:ankyrin repeat protein [Colletotrichum abscissum]